MLDSNDDKEMHFDCFREIPRALLVSLPTSLRGNLPKPASRNGRSPRARENRS